MALPMLVIPKATRLPVRLCGGLVAHPTSAYRLWKGHFESVEPIVGVAISITGTQVNWTRTSHRGTQSVETSILFSPFDEQGGRICVHFGIADAGVISQTIVESVQTQPAPLLQTFQTGELVSIASVGTNGVCELKALLLARKDVASVRNGVWHANGNTLINVEDTWRTVLTYGRTGNFERTAN